MVLFSSFSCLFFSFSFRPPSSASFVSEISTASKKLVIDHQRPDLSDLLSRYSSNRQQPPTETKDSSKKPQHVTEVEKEMKMDYLDRRLASQDPTLTLFTSSRPSSTTPSVSGSPENDDIDPNNAFKPNLSKKADREIQNHERKLSDIRKLKSSAEDFIQAARERAIARNNLLNGGSDGSESQMEKRAMTPYDKTRQEFAERRAKERADKKYLDKYHSYSDNECDFNSDDEDSYSDRGERRPNTNMGFYDKTSSPPENSRYHRGSHSRPSSRQDYNNRPSSRQDNYNRPSSRQEYHSRPSSRQEYRSRPSSKQEYHSRPSSRQEYLDYSDHEDADHDYNDRRRASRMSSKDSALSPYSESSNRKGSRFLHHDDLRAGGSNSKSASRSSRYDDLKLNGDRRRNSPRSMRHDDPRNNGGSPRSSSRSLRYEDLRQNANQSRNSPRSTRHEDTRNNGDRNNGVRSKSHMEKERRSSRPAIFDDSNGMPNDDIYGKDPLRKSPFSEKLRNKKYTGSRRNRYTSENDSEDDDDDVSLSRYDVNDDVSSLRSGDSSLHASYGDMRKLQSSSRGNSFEKDYPSNKRHSAKADDAEILSLHSRSRRPTSSVGKPTVVYSDNDNSGGDASSADDMNLDSLITRYLFKK